MPLDRQQREAWFSETVDPLLSEMVEAKVVDTPDDPRACMADYVDMDRDSGAISGSTSKAGWGRATRTASADSVGRLLAAADATAAKKEEVDTEAPEDVRDLNALLLPSGTLPLDVECFSVSYSTALFAGWVKQVSPCCAAASVAGAWNALSGRSRGVEGALSSELVLGAMRAVMEDKITAMTSRFERLLGGSVAPLLLAITTELSREGKHLGGQGARAAIAKAPHLLRLTRSITSRELDKEGHSPTFDLLWELYEDEKKAAEASGVTEEGLGTAMAAGRDRAVKQEAWTASVASDGAEDGISSAEDDVAAKHGGREESVGISTEDESGVGGANDAVSVVALAGEERGHPRPSPSGRPKGIDPANKCGQRIALRPGVGHHRKEGGGTIRTCRGGRGGQPRCRGRTQGSREEREEIYVGEEEVGEGEEDEGEKVMSSETKGGVSGGVCGLKGASEQRRGRKPISHGASSPKAKKGGGGEEQGRSTEWKWKKDLCSLLKLMGGLDKLCSKSPSTAAFGNAGLISTVRYLDGDLPHDGEVTARLFMGKGRARSVRLQVPLSAQDGEEEKAKQWAALREAFLTDRQVLLFHLTNHFALIFALREWRSSTGPTTTTAAASAATTTSTATAAATVATKTATTTASATAAATATAAINNQQSEAASLTTTLPSDSPDHPSESRYPAMPTTDDPGHSQGAAGGSREPVAGKGDRGVRQDRRGVPGGGWSRQMLTARRGQRPTAWVDFEEARRIMLGWEGYKIMTVRRGGAAAAAAVTLGGR